MELESDRRFRFAVTPDDFWAAAATTHAYTQWWPWLRSFDGRGLVAGDEWRCAVRPPLGYTLRFTVHLDEVTAPTTIRTRVDGDIAGWAQLLIATDGAGCSVHLTSRLTPASGVFRLVAFVGAPFARRGHDWILDTGADQFAHRALSL